MSKRKSAPQKQRPAGKHFQRTTLDEKNRFGTLPFDRLTWPTVGIHDAPFRCYRINLEWTPLITGLIGLLAETRMWKDVYEKDAYPIQQILEMLKGEDCLVVNCDEVDDCLETSESIAALTSFIFWQAETNTQNYFFELNLLYDGTPQSVGSSIPTTAPNLDSSHDNALCYVLEQMVSVYATTKGLALSSLAGTEQWVNKVIAAMRKIVPEVNQAFWYSLGDDLLGCAPDVPTALSALADNAAIIELACCLREELRTVAMSKIDFDAALATCSASLTGNAGIIACLFNAENSLNHYLSFLAAYNHIIIRQNAGSDFVCQCAPEGWFWVDLDWTWTTSLHGGEQLSPTFAHTNPSNGELFAIQFRHQRIGEFLDKSFGGVHPSGDPDSVVNGATGNQSSGLLLWEEPFIGVWEGRDAVGWPVPAARQADYVPAQRQPDITWTIKFHDRVDQGHTRQSHFSNMRLLYKEIP